MQNYEEIESSQRQHYCSIEHNEKMIALGTESMLSFVKSLNPKIYKDGDMWCVLYGSDIQSGICGFGKTISDAIINFKASFYV